MGKFWGLMLVDRQGHLWFGQVRQGSEVGRWDGQHFETFPLSLTTATFALLEDRSGRLWFGGSGSGGGIFQYDGERWTRFTGEIGIDPKRVQC